MEIDTDPDTDPIYFLLAIGSFGLFSRGIFETYCVFTRCTIG